MQPTHSTQRPDAASGLRYVGARQLSSDVLDLDRLEVKDASGEDLGHIDGFLVDTASARPRYVVVDSGGWFRSRRYLLPVDHARFDAQARNLRFDGRRDTIMQFPEIEDERIESLQADDLAGYDSGVTRVCCPDDGDLQRLEDERRRDTTSAWWHQRAWSMSYGEAGPGLIPPTTAGQMARGRDADERWRTPADEGRAPAVGERAQPGDVIGIESGGETTSIGDTAEDEDRRRERAERDLPRGDSDRDRGRR